MTATTERVQRLLAIIPWAAVRDGPTIEDVCSRFDVSERELLADLSLMTLVGVPPYTPDELFDVVVEDGRVWVYLSPSFRRPLRLTPEQGLALVAAGASLRGRSAADPEGALERALAKVARLLDIDPDEAVEVELGPVSPATLSLLRQAVAERRQVELDYYSYGRDERSVRVVDPHQVFAEHDQWYLRGFDHRRDERRVFRVDRIASARVLEPTFEPPTGSIDEAVSYDPAPDDPRITLDLAPDAGWVQERYPVEAVEEQPDGAARVTLAVSARPWLERLLLRLGSSARVVGQQGGSDDLIEAARGAAQRVLQRYGQGKPVPSGRREPGSNRHL